MVFAVFDSFVPFGFGSFTQLQQYCGVNCGLLNESTRKQSGPRKFHVMSVSSLFFYTAN